MASAAPTPELAPVITATLPLTFIALLLAKEIHPIEKFIGSGGRTVENLSRRTPVTAMSMRPDLLAHHPIDCCANCR
jgi:hypothetical protein